MNIENINKMIEAISAQKDPIYMSGFVAENSNECGTTACLAGWANILRVELIGQGKGSEDIEDTDAAAEWMGLGWEHARNLFYDYSADRLDRDDRKTATLELLTLLRDGKDARWDDVLPKFQK